MEKLLNRLSLLPYPPSGSPWPEKFITSFTFLLTDILSSAPHLSKPTLSILPSISDLIQNYLQTNKKNLLRQSSGNQSQQQVQRYHGNTIWQSQYLAIQVILASLRYACMNTLLSTENTSAKLANNNTQSINTTKKTNNNASANHPSTNRSKSIRMVNPTSSTTATSTATTTISNSTGLPPLTSTSSRRALSGGNTSSSNQQVVRND